MKANEAEIERASKQLSALLEQHRATLHEVTSSTRIAQIQTNIGTWMHYVIVDPMTVQHQSYALIACSDVPTSQVKVTLLEIIARRIAILLGADPTLMTVWSSDPVASRAGEDALDYHSIKTPVTVSITWNPGTPGN